VAKYMPAGPDTGPGDLPPDPWENLVAEETERVHIVKDAKVPEEADPSPLEALEPSPEERRLAGSAG